MLKRVIFAAIAALTLSVASTSAQVKFHTGSTDDLYKMAKESDKLVFVDLYADWCPPCKAMEKNVFSREDIGDFMSKYFVSAKYSVDDTIGKEFSKKYNVRSIPTYLIFNESGELIGQMTGGMSPEDLTKNLLKIKSEAK